MTVMFVRVTKISKVGIFLYQHSDIHLELKHIKQVQDKSSDCSTPAHYLMGLGLGPNCDIEKLKHNKRFDPLNPCNAMAEWQLFGCLDTWACNWKQIRSLWFPIGELQPSFCLKPILQFFPNVFSIKTFSMASTVNSYSYFHVLCSTREKHKYWKDWNIMDNFYSNR